ncbi:RING finger protein 145-like [Mercenaria mercenaria]|uniref:RING finger protein 145-like n=1 Tax=Mercenaria mercenaria TaxID=6596 RepID=UPI00234FAAA8|nr:RING finger protein 145-like [Mercenaria mercenaria]
METVEKGAQFVPKYTQRLFEHIEKQALRIGEKYDNYMDNTSPRKKYLCEILLRVPLIFIIHQWLLLSPYSNYWIIDIFLFIVRYGVVFPLVGTWAFNSGVLLQVYTVLTIDVAVTWLKRIDYWTHQDEEYGICHEKNVLVWTNITEQSRVPEICSISMQIVYLCCRPGAFAHRGKVHISASIYIGLFATLVPNILSVLSIFPSFLSEVSYWIESTLLITVCIFEVGSNMDADIKVDENKLMLLTAKHTLTIDEQTRLEYRTRIQDLQRRIEKRNQGGNYADRFPGKWFMRDTMLAFGALYFLFTLLIEITIYQTQLTSLSSSDTLFKVLTVWCTTHVIVVFISYGLGLLSNLCVALCHIFLTTEIIIIEAFDANIGGIVQVSALIAFTEANILSLEYTEKLEAMKMVVFLSVYAIIFQTLDVLEQKILNAVNSGMSPGVLFFMRVGILTGLLATVPTFFTIIVSEHLDINPWLLFIASGNCMLILRTVFMFLECTFVSFTWNTTQHLGRLEDLIHYTQVSKCLCLVVLNTLQSYYKYICPFFKGWWLLRLFVAVFSCLVVVCGFGMMELKRYNSRNRLRSLLNNLPDVTFKSTNTTNENSAEETQECAICYSFLSEGKTLPCKHAFHKDCLRRWFQVKAVCPFCNTEIK